MDQLKMKTCLAWISCLQKHKSPIDALIKKGVAEVIVYGIADLGEKFIIEALQRGYPIKAITDARIRKGGYSYRGIAVIPREELCKTAYKEVYVVITSMSFLEEIQFWLEEHNIVHTVSLLELME